jgi:hypothetical protein
MNLNLSINRNRCIPSLRQRSEFNFSFPLISYCQQSSHSFNLTSVGRSGKVALNPIVFHYPVDLIEQSQIEVYRFKWNDDLDCFAIQFPSFVITKQKLNQDLILNPIVKVNFRWLEVQYLIGINFLYVNSTWIAIKSSFTWKITQITNRLETFDCESQSQLFRFALRRCARKSSSGNNVHVFNHSCLKRNRHRFNRTCSISHRIEINYIASNYPKTLKKSAFKERASIKQRSFRRRLVQKKHQTIIFNRDQQYTYINRNIKFYSTYVMANSRSIESVCIDLSNRIDYLLQIVTFAILIKFLVDKIKLI